MKQVQKSANMLAAKPRLYDPEQRPVGTRIHRQVSRMIKHLRNQVNVEAMQLPMPTKWLIDQLVSNALADKKINLNVHRWDDIVLSTLHQIQHDTHSTPCPYRVIPTQTYLFPNDELLDEWEIHQFVSYLITYINANTEKPPNLN